MRVALLLATLAFVFPATAGAATLTATPSTFPAKLAEAQGGDTIELSNGDYFGWEASKPSMVTIRPAAGASPAVWIRFGPSASNLRIDGIKDLHGWDIDGSSNIEIVNSTFTEPMQVRGATSGIVFDNDTFYGLGHGTWEGRLSFAQGARDAVVRNSRFGRGGCSDGIQLTGGASNVTIEHNVFESMRQGSCGAHVDPIQFYGAHGTKVLSNYFIDNSTGIMSPDGNGSPMTVRNNVFVMDEYHGALVGGGTTDSTVTHNVVVGVGRAVHLIVDTANTGIRSRNTVVRDNVSSVVAEGDNLTVANNLLPSSVTFRGGTGRCRYALADGSNGKGAGLDGTDIGLTDCDGATTPPPPPPPPPPPESTAPTAAYSYQPGSPTTGQEVTFDASASVCADAPCTYVWEDDGPDGPGGTQWPLGSGRTMTFTFGAAGDKHVRLTVTGADGQSDAAVKTIAVSQAAPPESEPAYDPVCRPLCDETIAALQGKLDRMHTALHDTRLSYKQRVDRANAIYHE